MELKNGRSSEHLNKAIAYPEFCNVTSVRKEHAEWKTCHPLQESVNDSNLDKKFWNQPFRTRNDSNIPFLFKSDSFKDKLWHCRILSGDDPFSIILYMSQLDTQQMFKELYLIENGWEEKALT